MTGKTPSQSQLKVSVAMRSAIENSCAPEGSASPEHQESGDGKVSLIELLTILGRDKAVFLRTSFGLAAITALLALVLPPTYRASTSVLPPSQMSSPSAALLSQLSQAGSLGAFGAASLGLKNPNDMQVALLQSRVVEDAVIRKLDLQKVYRKKTLSDTRKALDEHTKIDDGYTDGVIRIDVEDQEAQRAADIANAYVAEYKNLVGSLAISEAAQRRVFFEQQLSKANENLAQAEENLKRTEKTTGVIHLDSQAKALVESAALLNAQISSKEVEIQTMKMYSSPKNGQLQLAEEQLSGLRSQLKQLQGSMPDDKSIIVRGGNVADAGVEYVRKVRQVKYWEAILELLSRQFEMASLDEAKQGAFVQVVDVAQPPDRRIFPKRALMTISGFALGLLGGILLIFGREGYRRYGSDPLRAAELEQLRSAWVKKASA
jgi:tyrosine-protein kinase Etk/Wzc